MKYGGRDTVRDPTHDLSVSINLCPRREVLGSPTLLDYCRLAIVKAVLPHVLWAIPSLSSPRPMSRVGDGSCSSKPPVSRSFLVHTETYGPSSHSTPVLTPLVSVVVPVLAPVGHTDDTHK